MIAATVFLGTVWMVNGLFAKVLGRVPRHRAIVARFFGDTRSHYLTPAIGLAEMGMGLWIFSGRYRGACFIAQAGCIVTMNSLELWRAQDLLLSPLWMPIANAFLLLLAFWWSRV